MMNSFLSSKAEYAVFAMLELALNAQEPAPLALRKISSKYGLKSEQFLVQVLLQLKSAGLIYSTRGASGGYHLTREPEQISLWCVLQAIESTTEEDSIALVEEPLLQVVQIAWNQANNARKEVLRSISLQDLIDKLRDGNAINNYQI